MLKQCTILLLWFFTYVWDNLNMADFSKTLVGLGIGIRVVVKKAEWSEFIHIEIYPIGMTRWTLLSPNHKENCVLPAPHKFASSDESACWWSYSQGQDLTPPHLHPPVSRFLLRVDTNRREQLLVIIWRNLVTASVVQYGIGHLIRRWFSCNQKQHAPFTGTDKTQM